MKSQLQAPKEANGGVKGNNVDSSGDVAKKPHKTDEGEEESVYGELSPVDNK